MPNKLGLLAFRSGEMLSYTAGVLATGFFVVQLAQGEVKRQGGIAEFEALAQASQEQPILAVAEASEASSAAQAVPDAGFADPDSIQPDTTLWAPGRIADYQASLSADLPPVLGVLEIPTVGLKVPVYQTASDLTMDRGAGIINGMSYPHEPGNIGISGHRDGYFRVLKDVKPGDTLELQTLEGPKTFTIDKTQVVEITDTHLLQDTRDQTLTLVTCYPFYFVGHAPQRFIVTASLDTTDVNQNQRRN
jgi:LPXTG-site transpeptidase (sortase) family protein